MLKKPMYLILYLLIICILNSLCYRYVFYKNRKFPLDDGRKDIKFYQEENITLNNDSIIIDSSKKNCNNEIKSDMNCDIINNIKECDFDGGDCCRPSCKKICEEKGISSENCKCGKEGYNCLSENTGECENCVHGKCETNMNNCYLNENDIKSAIRSCKLNSYTNGNMNTSNYYCGKDPLRNIIHIRSSPNTHYPGCGLNSINCTLLPCCTQVEMNSDTPENCNNIPTNRYVYDNSLGSFELKFISCIQSYRNCFKENAAGAPRGQCCICEDGWGGPFCDIPLCDNCIHGTCIGRNECLCDENYIGESCDIAICSECINGECIEPGKCECFYGYKGNHCEDPETTPFCYRGIEKLGDKCECENGYKGNLCEIKICYDVDGNNCDACDEDGNCYKRIDKKCERIHPYCLECDIDNLKCLKCDEDKNYFLNNGNCIQMWQIINNCFKGDGNICTECSYPYFINEEKNECLFSGIIEINQLFYNIFISDFNSAIDDNIYNFNILFNRLYGFEGKCIIDYKLLPKSFLNYDRNNEINSYINNPLNFSPLSNGKIIFENNEIYKNIKIPIFYLNKYFLPSNNEILNVFTLEILNNVGNCIIGDIYKCEIEIFDDNNIGDIFTHLNPSIFSDYLTLQQKEDISNCYKVFLDTKIITYKIQVNFDDNIVNPNVLDNYFIISYLTKIESDKSIELTKKINYNSVLQNFQGEISYEELSYNMDHTGTVKNFELNTCCCSNTNNIQIKKIFKMDFYNYAGIIEGDKSYYRRFMSYIDVDDYYKKNHVGYYSIKWTFYISEPNNIIYIKIIKNINSYVTFIVNRKIISNYKSILNNDLFYELYYKIDNNNLNNMEFVIEYIHISNEPKINIEYSSDDVYYENISSKSNILHIYSCEPLTSYSLEIY